MMNERERAKKILNDNMSGNTSSHISKVEHLEEWIIDTMIEFHKSENDKLTEENLRQTFKNNSDCYADTWLDIGFEMKEGEVIQAMTEDQFVKIIDNLINK